MRFFTKVLLMVPWKVYWKDFDFSFGSDQKSVEKERKGKWTKMYVSEIPMTLDKRCSTFVVSPTSFNNVPTEGCALEWYRFLSQIPKIAPWNVSGLGFTGKSIPKFTNFWRKNGNLPWEPWDVCGKKPVLNNLLILSPEQIWIHNFFTEFKLVKIF